MVRSIAGIAAAIGRSCLARIARTATTTAPPPSSKRPVLARCPDVASTRAAAAPPAVALPVADRSGHVGDQDVSAQIVQPSDALGATDPLAQRTLPRSASKHPDCRSRAGAGVDHADQIAGVETPLAAAWSRARLLVRRDSGSLEPDCPSSVKRQCTPRRRLPLGSRRIVAATAAVTYADWRSCSPLREPRFRRTAGRGVGPGAGLGPAFVLTRVLGYGQDTRETGNRRLGGRVRLAEEPGYSSTGSRSTALLRSSAVGLV